MLFPSGGFLFVFLPIVLAGFFAIGRFAGMQAAAAWLALSSFFFYGFWRLEDVPLLAASIALNYFAGSAIQSGFFDSRIPRKAVLGIAVTINLGLLAWFKYANFVLESINYVAGTRFDALNVTLPIGISFFTFTQIAYLVDSYAGKVRERNPVHYALFVTYFPHLIAGPVLHHAEMMPQFAKPRTYRPQLIGIVLGLLFLAIGLAKKVLVADSAAPIANTLFDSVGHRGIGALDAWQGVVAYTVQIYYDFSGYSDMAIGLSLLFGIRLPYNFDSPYKARSIIDFWRRWHITLSRFLRDYLYFALGGNRKGVARRYANLGITMLLGGLWHGASWTFVVWGALHGAFLIVNHGWRHVSRPFLERMSWTHGRVARIAGSALSLAITLTCVMIAWVFFRAASFTDATQVIAAMIGLGPAIGAVAPETAPDRWLWLGAAMVIAMAAPNSQQWVDQRLRPRLERLSTTTIANYRIGAAIGSTAVVITMLAFVSASREVSEFIYFNF